MGHTLTLRELREITGEPAHVINHAIDRYGPPPVGRIGITRIWNRADLAKIKASLAKTAAHHSSVARRKAAEK